MEFGEQPKVVAGRCTCTIGQGGSCGHLIGLLYTIAHYKMLQLKAVPQDIAKTSLPQTWHVPRGQKITSSRIDNLDIASYNRPANTELEPQSNCNNIKSTLTNPVRVDFPDFGKLGEELAAISPRMLALPSLTSYSAPTPAVQTKFGQFSKFSLVGIQQKLDSDLVLNLYDGVAFPSLPLNNVMKNNYASPNLPADKLLKLSSLHLSVEECRSFETLTKKQADNKLWHQIREHRITASKIGEVVSCKPQNFEKRAKDLKNKKPIKTAAMKLGSAREPLAAQKYSEVKHNEINMWPSGIIVSPWAPWIAASPDRKVYDPSRNPQFGLLEIKCPDNDSPNNMSYLRNDGNGLKLNKKHAYYYQVMTQLAVTGLEWCDFFVYCHNTKLYHLEEIKFDPEYWQGIKDKVDNFYFDYYL